MARPNKNFFKYRITKNKFGEKRSFESVIYSDLPIHDCILEPSLPKCTLWGQE